MNCTPTAPLTILPLGYGPTPLHTYQGEQAFFEYEVTGDPKFDYESVTATVDIHDGLGNITRSLATDVTNRISAGPISVSWDGNDSMGKPAPPGDYAPTFTVQAKRSEPPGACAPFSGSESSSAISCSGMTIPPPQKPPTGDGGDSHDDKNNNTTKMKGGGGGGGGTASSPSGSGDATSTMFAAQLPDDTSAPCSDGSTGDGSSSTMPSPIKPGSSETYNITTDAKGNITLNLWNGFDMSRPIQSLSLGNGFKMWQLPDLYNGFLWPSFNLPDPWTIDLTNGWRFPRIDF